MRKVVSPDMVAHLWANQSQSDARNAGNTFYFVDTTIYSYGGHFPIARHVNGEVLMTTRRYSTTTARHIRKVESASRQFAKVYCYNVQAESKTEHYSNLKHIEDEFNTYVMKAAKARHYTDSYLAYAENQAQQYVAYCELFKLAYIPLTIPEDYKSQCKVKIQAQKKYRAEQEVLQAKKAEEERVKLLEAYEQWKLGEQVHCNFYSLPIALRLCANGDNVETSKGAEVPKSHALRVWKFINSLLAKNITPMDTDGTLWRKNGHTFHVGHFQIDTVYVNGDFVAGCHRIDYTELQRFAKVLQWDTLEQEQASIGEQVPCSFYDLPKPYNRGGDYAR